MKQHEMRECRSGKEKERSQMFRHLEDRKSVMVKMLCNASCILFPERIYEGLVRLKIIQFPQRTGVVRKKINSHGAVLELPEQNHSSPNRFLHRHVLLQQTLDCLSQHWRQQPHSTVWHDR